VIASAELREVRSERTRGGTCAKRRVRPNEVRALMHYPLSDQTRKAGIVHEAREFPFDLDCANHVGNPSRLGLIGGRSRTDLDRTTCQCTMKAAEPPESVAVRMAQSFLEMKRRNKVRYRTNG
jgi:hypothetical protein